jgi:hypothetical protein
MDITSVRKGPFKEKIKKIEKCSNDGEESTYFQGSPRALSSPESEAESVS